MSIKNRGFASLTPEQRKEIASAGGKKVQALGTAHRWNAITASLAGRKGWAARDRKRKEVNK